MALSYGPGYMTSGLACSVASEVIPKMLSDSLMARLSQKGRLARSLGSMRCPMFPVAWIEI